jgi:DNA-binding MarR family transcriptional regulator
MEPQPAAQLLPLLGILSQLFQARTDTLLQPSGLSYTQMAVLTHLARQDHGQSISELATAFEIQQPGMSKVVKRLESSGAVTTKTDPADPRRKLVSISKTGSETTETAGAVVIRDVQQWFDGWSEQEVAHFTAAVGRLVGWLDENRLGAD